MKEIVISDFRDVQQGLRNEHLKQSLYDAGGVIMDDVLLTLHGAEHRLRRTTEFRVFGRGFFRYYENEVFPRTLSRTLAPYLEAGGADLVDLGYRVTLNLTADFSGIDRPEESRAETLSLLKLTKTFSEGATLVHSKRDHDEVRAEVKDALDVFDRDFLQPSVAPRRAKVEAFEAGDLDEADLPRDIITILLRFRDKLNLPSEVFRREIAFYLQAGSHSTGNSTTHALHDILDWCDAHPGDRERMKTDPLFLQRCVHESLRLHPASPVAWRSSVCPTQLLDSDELAEGDAVVFDLYNANRDTKIFGDDANAFNPHRELPQNVWPFGLTFGFGVHACLGRDLDGGVVPKAGMKADDCQLGIVTLFVRELLRNGARRDPDNPPVPDVKTERPNWGSYPILFGPG